MSAPNPVATLYVTDPQLADVYPTTRGEYNTLRGWTVPPNEDANDAGYRVVNLVTGHTNWYPEAVFRAGHTRVADVAPGEASHVLRIRAEVAELEGRLVKLRKFLESDQSRKLDPEDLTLLRGQRMAMEAYKEILHRRLRRATTTTTPLEA